MSEHLTKLGAKLKGFLDKKKVLEEEKSKL